MGDSAATEPLADVAETLGIPWIDVSDQILASDEIGELIQQSPPYLVLARAMRGKGRSLLAEARFSPDTCDGHYPNRPCMPLVDLGRAMDQAATLLAASRYDDWRLPLSRRANGLKGHSVQHYEVDDRYWVLASEESSQISTKIFSTRTMELLASIRGFEHEFIGASAIGTRAMDSSSEEWRLLSTDEVPLDVSLMT